MQCPVRKLAPLNLEKRVNTCGSHRARCSYTSKLEELTSIYG